MQGATAMVTIMLVSWPLMVFILMLMMDRDKAVLFSFLFAWMFLPVATFRFTGLPEYNKMTATALGIVLSTAILDVHRILRLRPCLPDGIALVMCLCPFASSMANGLGPYDGLSASFSTALQWGLPYLIGRIYFSSPQSLRALTIGIFIGGLIYVPFCLFEVRMSPQLHRMVYGYQAHSFAQTARGGGWRPTVFMAHGLMVGMWMSTATLAGFWVWRTRALPLILGIPVQWYLAVLAVTTVLCKSTGALVLLGVGLVIVLIVRRRPTIVPFYLLAGMVVLYPLLRATGLWDGQWLIDASNLLFGSARSESLATRVFSERILAQHGMLRPVLGWGGWGRNRPAGVTTITDSLWIITFGTRGLLGLASLFGTMLAPVLLLHRRVPVRLWRHPAMMGVLFAATASLLWMCDNLFNAMFNPIFVIMAGGLASLIPPRFAPMTRGRGRGRGPRLEPMHETRVDMH